VQYFRNAMSAAIFNLIPHLRWWGYGFLAVAVFLIATYLFAREILKQIYDQLSAIAKIFVGFFQSIGKLFFQLAQAVWRLWGLMFALRWRFQFAIRNIFARTTLGVLAVSAFYLFAELMLALPEGLKHELPEMYGQVNSWSSSRFPSAHAWLSTLKVPHIKEVPFKAELILLVLAVLMFRHHLREFAASMRREAVPPALEEVFLEFDKFRDIASPDSVAKNNFLEILMKKLKDVLDEKDKALVYRIPGVKRITHKRDVAFSLFEEEAAVDDKGIARKTGNLAISFLPANSPLDQSVRIPIGQGGAGKAFQAKVAIYIPSVRHLIGIDMDSEKSVGLTYFPHKHANYKARSILSVPVLVNSKQDAIAVIAVSSRKRKTFWDADFEIVRLAASIISALY
jgi:hypothetical protein